MAGSQIIREPAIVAKGVRCSFGNKEILHGVDITLRRGQVTVALGPSGAGKSTLLRAIAGLEPLTGGTIVAPGGELSQPGVTVPPEYRDIGLVVQDFALFPHLTALQNIAFGLKGADRETIARNWLQRIGLAHRGTAYPHELSGGEQQRIALARALARSPSVVLLDEAFSSLDLQLRRELRREALAMLRATDAAVLLVTHDPEEAMEMADELIVMDAGSIAQSGAPAELYWQPGSRVVARLLGPVNELTGRCQDGSLATAFGAFPAPKTIDGAKGFALVRPAAVALYPDAHSQLHVTEIRFLGSHSRMRASYPDGEEILADMPGNVTLSAGDAVGLEIDAERVVVLSERT